MSNSYSLEELAASVQTWCDENRLLPANGQAAEKISERTIRYYRTIGLLDAPLGGYIKTFSEKHRLQLLAIRVYQAMGLPLRKIRDELYGQSEDMLHELVTKPTRREVNPLAGLRTESLVEQWRVFRLTDDVLLISRQGRALPPDLIGRIQEMMSQAPPEPSANGRRKPNP